MGPGRCFFAAFWRALGPSGALGRSPGGAAAPPQRPQAAENRPQGGLGCALWFAVCCGRDRKAVGMAGGGLSVRDGAVGDGAGAEGGALGRSPGGAAAPPQRPQAAENRPQGGLGCALWFAVCCGRDRKAVGMAGGGLSMPGGGGLWLGAGDEGGFGAQPRRRGSAAAAACGCGLLRPG